MDNRCYIDTYDFRKLELDELFCVKNPEKMHCLNMSDIIEGILIHDQIKISSFSLYSTLSDLIKCLGSNTVMTLIRDQVISFVWEEIEWDLLDIHRNDNMLYKLRICPGPKADIEQDIQKAIDRLEVSQHKKNKLFKDILNSQQTVDSTIINRELMYKNIEEMLNAPCFAYDFLQGMFPYNIKNPLFKDKIFDFRIEKTTIYAESLLKNDTADYVKRVYQGTIIPLLYKYYESTMVASKLQCVSYCGSKGIKKWQTQVVEQSMNMKFENMLYMLDCPDVVADVQNGKFKGDTILRYRDMLAKYRNFLYTNKDKEMSDLMREYNRKIKEEEKEFMGFNFASKTIGFLFGLLHPFFSFADAYLKEPVLNKSAEVLKIPSSIKLDKVIK